MARLANKLSARKVETLKAPGRYSDGAGLYLRITEDSRKWTFMFTWAGKKVEIGLGSLRDVSLAAAREKAGRYREMVASGSDPREERKPKRVWTFSEVALEFLDDKEGGWKNEKHRDQWRYTLSLRKDEAGAWIDEGYCRSIRDKPIENLSTDDVLAILKPIWISKSETASRVRGRVEAVWNAAKARGRVSGENPARWRGHLSNLLTKRERLQRGHHAAMPFSDVPAFFQKIVNQNSSSSQALAFTVLTAARSGETMGARWSEIEDEGRIWRIPGARMKAKKEHVVPLSDAAWVIIESMRGKSGEFVFPGARAEKLSVMALTMVLRRAGGGEYTTHGFRSSFRDWCGDATNFQQVDVEMCLAHAVRNATEAAYRRGNALGKRREIMSAWANFLSRGEAANVIDFGRLG